MRADVRGAFGAIAWLLFAASASCTLLNPLDHLQSGRRAGEGDASSLHEDAGAGLDAAAAADADDAPGCGPSRWSSCGVFVVASSAEPGDAVFASLGSSTSVFFTDRASGEVSKTACTTAGCAAPTVVASGEDAPARLAFESDSLFWTTPTSIRRLRVNVPPDGGDPSPETIDAAEGATGIIAEYPFVLWTDAKGVRGWSLSGPITKFWTKPAAYPVLSAGAVFVSEGHVERCDWAEFGATSCPASGVALPGSQGAHALAFSSIHTDFFHPGRGLIAATDEGAGARLLVLDELDDAGAPFVLADETDRVVSIGGSSVYLYWTTSSGALRRRAKDASPVTTLLHGLSGDTSIAVSDALVLITDRGNGRILTLAP
jgi:hypothetical protein